MKLIVGLGNIGRIYEDTYHNVGFLVADRIARKLNTRFNKKECESDIATATIENEKIIIAKPRTYMNDSGRAVNLFLKKYPCLQVASDIIIIYDDIDLPAGEVKIKEIGGPGSHNGVKSVFSVLKTRNFRKVRVGINEKPDNVSMVEFVLSKIKPKSAIRQGIALAGDSLVEFLTKQKSYSEVMNEVNSRF